MSLCQNQKKPNFLPTDRWARASPCFETRGPDAVPPQTERHEHVSARSASFA